MGPAVLGVSVAQNQLAEVHAIFASFLDTGGVSWLYYADRLMEFPAGMLGAALNAIFATFAGKVSRCARTAMNIQSYSTGACA